MNLKNQLIKANKTIEQQKLKIEELQNKLNNYNNTINNYNNIINQKDNELNNLRTQLNNINNNMNNNININMNDIMSVNFISMDQNVHFSVACLKNNTFAEVEEKYINNILNIEKQIIILLLMEHKYLDLKQLLKIK